MLLTLAVWAVHPGKRVLPNLQHVAYAAFALAVAVAWVTSPWMDGSQPLVEDYFKVLVFYLLLVTSVHDEAGLRRVVGGFLAVMGLYLTHSLREFLGGRHVYRMGITPAHRRGQHDGRPEQLRGDGRVRPAVRRLPVAGRGRRPARPAGADRVHRAVGGVRAAHRLAVQPARPRAVGDAARPPVAAAVPVPRPDDGGRPGRVRGPARVAADPVRDHRQPGRRAGERQGVGRGPHPGLPDRPRPVGRQPAHRGRPRGVAARDEKSHRVAQPVRPALRRTRRPRGVGVPRRPRLLLAQPPGRAAGANRAARVGRRPGVPGAGGGRHRRPVAAVHGQLRAQPVPVLVAVVRRVSDHRSALRRGAAGRGGRVAARGRGRGRRPAGRLDRSPRDTSASVDRLPRTAPHATMG